MLLLEWHITMTIYHTRVENLSVDVGGSKRRYISWIWPLEWNWTNKEYNLTDVFFHEKDPILYETIHIDISVTEILAKHVLTR